MSLIALQLGQCGNQLGQSFFTNLDNEASNLPPAYANCIRNTFFTETQKKFIANAVLIDMEPKVVNNCLAQSYQNWQYSSKLTFCQQEGSGNNWAYGYNVHGARWSDEMMQRVRKLAEAQDCLQGIIVFQSLAGGTGSGVGAFLTQQVRNQYEEIPILNTVVWPYKIGEVIVQNYNTILTLSNLIDVADGLLLIKNDWLQHYVKYVYNKKNVSFQDMNNLASQLLSSALIPSLNDSTSQTSQYGVSPYSHIIDVLCSTPSFPLLHLLSAPITAESSLDFSNNMWHGLINRAYNMLVSDTIEPSINYNMPLNHPNRNKIVGVVNVIRGNQLDQCNTNEFRNSQLYCDWSFKKYQEIRFGQGFMKYDKKITVVANSQSIIGNMDEIVDKTYEMFQSQAYLHHYERFGIDRDYFNQFAFPKVEQIVYNYKNL